MFKVTTMDFPDDIENPQVETRGEFKDYDAAVAAAQVTGAFYTIIESNELIWETNGGVGREVVNRPLAKIISWLPLEQQQAVIDLVDHFIADTSYKPLPAVV